MAGRIGIVKAGKMSKRECLEALAEVKLNPDLQVCNNNQWDAIFVLVLLDFFYLHTCSKCYIVIVCSIAFCTLHTLFQMQFTFFVRCKGLMICMVTCTASKFVANMGNVSKNLRHSVFLLSFRIVNSLQVFQVQ
mgnify:CR=1 FL=1